MRIEHQTPFSKKNELVVKAYEGDLEIGEVQFWISRGNKVMSGWTYVHPDYRKQKLASLMYMHAYDLGYTIEPSPCQTDEGKLMWQGFRKAGLPFTKRLTWFEKLWTSSLALIG